MSEGQWRTVTRRKPYPANWRHAPELPLANKPFTPYLPTFAHIVRRSPTKDAMAAATPKLPLPKQIPHIPASSTQPPILPQTPCTTTALKQPLTTPNPASLQYTTTHTTPGLRFPPSPAFPEWRGRCFRCCQIGHTVATCKNLTKCGRCWGDGHIGQRCNQGTNRPPKSRNSPTQPSNLTNTLKEPSFDELLEGAYPYTPRPLPQGHRAKMCCYISRDEEHFKEVERLKGSVVLYALEIEFNLSIDQIAEYAAITGLVTIQEVSIGILTKSRYLIHLPPKVEPIQFIKAIPISIWEKGYSFWQWSPATDSSRCNPKYKALLDLDGVPLHLSNENDVAKAIGAFGLYLRTVEQNTAGDMACWTVAVAVTELENIPMQIEFVVGGWATPVDARAKTWLPILLFKVEEISKPPEIYIRPVLTLVARSTSLDDDRSEQEGDNTVPISKSVILELCKGRELNSLPPEVWEIVAGEAAKIQRSEINSNNTRAARIEVPNNPPQGLLTSGHPNPDEDVADLILEEIIKETQGLEGTVSQEIPLHSDDHAEFPDIETVLPNNSALNLSKRTNGDKKDRKLKQKMTDTCPVRRSEVSNGGVFKKEGTKMTHGDHLVMHTSVIHKRKPALTSRGETSRRPKPKIQGLKKQRPKGKKTTDINETGRAQLNFDPHGYFEVHIDAQHCENIAMACRISEGQINSLLAQDNSERVIQQQLRLQDEMDKEPEGDETISDFNPLSEDEMTSDSD